MPRSGNPSGTGIAPSSIAEIKAVLSLRDTVERLAGVRFASGGGRLKACCPFHQERTPSFFVDEEAGRYKCFGSGCGRSGDVIQFIADWHSLSFREAVCHAADIAGLPMQPGGNASARMSHGSDNSVWAGLLPESPAPAKPPPQIEIAAIPVSVNLPLPGDLVTVTDDQDGKRIRVRPSHVHSYKSLEDETLCLVLRARTKDGGKFFIQAKWGPDSSWRLARFDRGCARPVYGLEDAREWSRNDGRHILIVEGETTRDAAARLLPAASGWLPLTAMGGSNAVGLADWQPLIAELAQRRREAGGEFTVTVWPDADANYVSRQGIQVDPKIKFFESVRSSVEAAAGGEPDLAGQLRFVRVEPPDSVPHGWDIADAAKEGWNAERLLQQIWRCDPSHAPESCAHLAA